MKLLSRSEEIILVTILKLGENAYGVSIQEQIQKDTGDEWSFASIYQPLMRLTRKQYVSRIKGDPSSERGGKSKYFYQLTRDGKQALLEIKSSHEKVWKGAPKITSDQIRENE
jgi:DNA-binding PadR family transcriptional regulator